MMIMNYGWIDESQAAGPRSILANAEEEEQKKKWFEVHTFIDKLMDFVSGLCWSRADYFDSSGLRWICGRFVRWMEKFDSGQRDGSLLGELYSILFGQMWRKGRGGDEMRIIVGHTQTIKMQSLMSSEMFLD